MEHISENDLALFAFDPDAVPPGLGAQIQTHTQSCEECRAALDFFVVTEEALHDRDVWEPITGSATLDSLRAHADRIAFEDGEADEMLAPFFSNPATADWTSITTRERFLTGGVARRLSAHAHDVCESAPLDALKFADAAISVAEGLPDDAYPAKAVFELRGTAWKERANALRLTGEFKDALEALDYAEHRYQQLTSAALGLSTVAYVRGTVLYEQQRLTEADSFASLAEQGFRHLGDEERRMRALYLRATIRVESQDLANAVDLYAQILRHGESVHDAVWTARAAYAIGHCEVDRGNLAAASAHLHKALTIFRETGPYAQRIATEWGIARVLLQSGNRDEAIRRLRGVSADFEEAGMVTESALAGLDTADALLAAGRASEIVELASQLFRVFTNAGMLTGALTAMAYIRETADAGTLTPVAVDTVRTFLHKVQRKPDLLFAPPP